MTKRKMRSKRSKTLIIKFQKAAATKKVTILAPPPKRRNTKKETQRIPTQNNHLKMMIGSARNYSLTR